MVLLEGLSLQGIRAFNPNPTDEALRTSQTILFRGPLTVILGQNGAGKTTIIEALRAATTGELPMGGTRGRAFVSDPALAGDATVRGMVKAQFRASDGTSSLVIRTYELATSGKRQTFRTLEVVVQQRGPSGAVDSRTIKATEADKEVPAMLGVSRAVLENVVFCPQDDVCWPLAEGSALKDRFDDIFATTRYSRALDALRREHKARLAEARSLDAELLALTERRAAATRLRGDVADADAAVALLDGRAAAARVAASNAAARQAEVAQARGVVADAAAARASLETALMVCEKRARLAAATAAVAARDAQIAAALATARLPAAAGADPEAVAKSAAEAAAAEVASARQELAELEGRAAATKEVRAQRQKQLAHSDYSLIDERWVAQGVKCVAMERAAADLKAYAAALDRAIMSYHVEKLAQVNALIRDLWARTYRGSDIDYIEIHSDAIPVGDADPDDAPPPAKRARGGAAAAAAAAAKAATASRVRYSYRVVMVRDGVAVDMRGRCSAGQRVLACLVVRLALSEAFCGESGMLALDEPTTNLDHANIASLAAALAAIVDARRDSPPVQLVVITHDEEFARTLCRAASVDHFYAVAKDPRGFSSVARRRLADVM